MTDPIQTLRDAYFELADTTDPLVITLADKTRVALTQVETLVRAAQTVNRTEATGVLPDFQPLADALAPFKDTP